MKKAFTKMLWLCIVGLLTPTAGFCQEAEEETSVEETVSVLDSLRAA